jgi:hypothetical protein
VKWHLGQLRRVIKSAPEVWDPSAGKTAWKYQYLFDGNDIVDNHGIRAPEEALKRIFGFRPWVWQQWAIVGGSVKRKDEAEQY